MSSRRTRVQYCKIIILTSMVWVMVDVFILMYFTDCAKMDPGCHSNGESKNVDRNAVDVGVPAHERFLEKLVPKGNYLIFSFLMFLHCIYG